MPDTFNRLSNVIRSIYDATLIRLPKILDPRGNLTFIEEQRHIPFRIASVYWIYDVPGEERIEEHAFQEQEEVIIALSGSFDVFLDDGSAQKIVHLNRSYHGLYVPGMIWRRMQNFSSNSVAYVLASCANDGNDYVRDYDHYKVLMREKNEHNNS